MEELDIGWQLVIGETPILLVASHNFPNERSGVIKPSDMGTGDVVRRLCSERGCFGMVTTRIQEDPNWYVDSGFRNEVKRIIDRQGIKLVIDIHGRSLGGGNLVEYLPNESFENSLGRLLEGKVVKQFVDNDQLTLIEDLGISMLPGIEIEIREDGRIETIDPESYAKANQELKTFLADAITSL